MFTTWWINASIHADDRDNITDRIIQDVLIVGCSSSHAKDKIVRKGSAVSLKEVLEILQTEESTTKTLSTIGADTQKIHYARYDKKKSGSKGGKQKSGQPSTFKKPDSKPADGPMCYRCGKTFTKEHDKVCKAKTAKCDSCQTVGHYSKCCIKTGKLKKPPNTWKCWLSTLLEHTNQQTCIMMKMVMYEPALHSTCYPRRKASMN